MGTRNITSVVLNGKQMVCQYGQWDGYPSYTGVKILEFLRDCDMDRFRKALENTTIHVSHIDDAITYTGSTKQLGNIPDMVFKTQCELSRERNQKGYIDGFATVRHLVEKGAITEQAAEDYLVATRDTGCNILKLIYNRPLDKLPLDLFALNDEYDGHYSWDIQGIYVLDLDNKTIKMTYDGYSQKYDIAHLPTEIEKEMLIFEKTTRELYEFSYREENPALAAEEDHGALYRKAEEIALKIGEEIKTEYPELFSASDQTIAAESFGHTMAMQSGDAAATVNRMTAIGNLSDEDRDKLKHVQGGTRTHTGPDEEKKQQLRECFRMAKVNRELSKLATNDFAKKKYLAEARKRRPSVCVCSC